MTCNCLSAQLTNNMITKWEGCLKSSRNYLFSLTLLLLSPRASVEPRSQNSWALSGLWLVKSSSFPGNRTKVWWMTCSLFSELSFFVALRRESGSWFMAKYKESSKHWDWSSLTLPTELYNFCKFCSLLRVKRKLSLCWHYAFSLPKDGILLSTQNKVTSDVSCFWSLSSLSIPGCWNSSAKTWTTNNWSNRLSGCSSNLMHLIFWAWSQRSTQDVLSRISMNWMSYGSISPVMLALLSIWSSTTEW